MISPVEGRLCISECAVDGRETMLLDKENDNERSKESAAERGENSGVGRSCVGICISRLICVKFGASEVMLGRDTAVGIALM
jgi:hypothetical protein